MSNDLIRNQFKSYVDLVVNSIKLSNEYIGKATLNSGSVTVLNKNVKSDSHIFVHHHSISGTIGTLSISNIIDDTSFVIQSVNSAGNPVNDDSEITWVLLK